MLIVLLNLQDLGKKGGGLGPCGPPVSATYGLDHADLMFADDIYMCSAPVLVGCNAFWIWIRDTLDQCSPAVKNTLFRAYCMPMYAC